MARLEAKTENSSDKSLFTDVEKPKANNRINPALDRKGKSNRQIHTRHLMVRGTKRGQAEK